jgi:hypothetical protein
MTLNFFETNVPVLISDTIKSEMFRDLYTKMNTNEFFVPRSAKFQVLSKGPNGNYYKVRIWDSGNNFVGIVREYGDYTKHREVVFLQGSNRSFMDYVVCKAPDTFVNDYISGMLAASNAPLKYNEIYWSARITNNNTKYDDSWLADHERLHKMAQNVDNVDNVIYDEHIQYMSKMPQ